MTRGVSHGEAAPDWIWIVLVLWSQTFVSDSAWAARRAAKFLHGMDERVR